VTSEDQLAEAEHDGQADQEDDRDDPQENFHRTGSRFELRMTSVGAPNLGAM